MDAVEMVTNLGIHAICSAKIRADLSRHGYAVLRGTCLDDFNAISTSFGRIAQRTDVRLVEGGIQYPSIADAIPFHTDNPKMAIVAWLCAEQDDTDGSNLILDSRTVLAQMSKQERSTLSRIRLKMRSRDEYHPLLIPGQPPHVFYVPLVWQEQGADLDSMEAETMHRFHELVAQYRTTKRYHSIRLLPGDALFIDNRFMLHGRDRIAPDSSRFLVRHLIDCGIPPVQA